MAKNVQSAAQPGCTQDATGKVGAHFSQPHPAASGTSDMRDGDSDSGAVTPDEPMTTVPGSAASEAWRGGGTP